ncbi:MAG: hypothetical protein ACK5IJ_02720 [Mangrovibacterium sp.]
MKELFKIGIIVVAVGMMVVSCSKDSTEEVNFGNLTIGTQQYTLAHAYMETYGQEGEGYNIDLTLVSSTSLNQNSTNEASIYLEIFSNLENMISEGSYTANNYSSREVFTYTDRSEVVCAAKLSALGDGFVAREGSVCSPLEGTLRVTLVDSKYTFDFQGTTTEFQLVNGEKKSDGKEVVINFHYEGTALVSSGNAFFLSKNSSAKKLIEYANEY